MAADYEVTFSMTDSESFRFTVPILDADGDPLDLTGKTFEYALWGNGEDILLDATDGVSVDLETSIVTVSLDADRRLREGLYQHGFRSTSGDGETVQHFDGTVTVSEGGF